MKKLLFSAVALLVLAGSSASAITISNAKISVKPTKPSTPSTDSGQTTDSMPPCPYNDPTGCHILD